MGPLNSNPARFQPVASPARVSVARTEAVRPVPGKDRAAHDRKDDTRVEPCEPPSPARELTPCCSINFGEIDAAMSEGDAVTAAGRNEPNVSVEVAGVARGFRIDDP